MTVWRCASENEVASPVVPSTLRPSQPLSRRKRASLVARAQSGSPVWSIAVAIAAITPPSVGAGIGVSLVAALESAADVVRGEPRHVDEFAVGGRQADDLDRP